MKKRLLFLAVPILAGCGANPALIARSPAGPSLSCPAGYVPSCPVTTASRELDPADCSCVPTRGYTNLLRRL